MPASAEARRQLRLDACARALPPILDELRQSGAETWRNLASRLLVRLADDPLAVIRPICALDEAGPKGAGMAPSAWAAGAAEVLRGVAAAILVGGQPITISGVCFEDPRAKGAQPAVGPA